LPRILKKQYEQAQKSNRNAAAATGGSVDSSAGAPITSAPTPAARTTSTSSNSAAATKGKAATTSQPPGKDNASGESAWRKLNKTFRSHMDKDVKSQATAAADWSTAMSEYLIFAHKLRGDKGPAQNRVISSKKKSIRRFKYCIPQMAYCSKGFDT